MVVLKKLKASTLMETLVATVLIVVVFMVASMILNNLFLNIMTQKTTQIEAHLKELQYLYINDKIRPPYHEELGEWKISIMSFNENESKIIEFEAKNPNLNQVITKQIYEVE